MFLILLCGWHGMPLLFNNKDINPISKKTYSDLYDKTLERIELIRSAGYNIITMREHDFIIEQKI